MRCAVSIRFLSRVKSAFYHPPPAGNQSKPDNTKEIARFLPPSHAATRSSRLPAKPLPINPLPDFTLRPIAPAPSAAGRAPDCYILMHPAGNPGRKRRDERNAHVGATRGPGHHGGQAGMRRDGGLSERAFGAAIVLDHSSSTGSAAAESSASPRLSRRISFRMSSAEKPARSRLR
jgi:hypothetical protein